MKEREAEVTERKISGRWSAAQPIGWMYDKDCVMAALLALAAAESELPCYYPTLLPVVL